MPENKTEFQRAENQNEEENEIKVTSDRDMVRESDDENKVEAKADAENQSSSKIAALEARNQELEKEVEANYDRFVRATADLENYKKRTSREMSDLRKFANENILKEMLSVVDNLQRAIESGAQNEGDKKKLLEGVEITLKDVLRILERYGVNGFESIGEDFDPAFHQAMMQEQTDKYPDNTVLNEIQKGYTIHDRLLRPAMVVVGRNPSDVKTEEKDETNKNEGI
jgi:molecular chaperone GrpE